MKGEKSTHLSLQPGYRSCILVVLTAENQQKEGGPRLEIAVSSILGRLAVNCCQRTLISDEVGINKYSEESMESRWLPSKSCF